MDKITSLRKVLGREKRRKNNELVFVCPIKGCRKDRAKLSVNIVTDRFHCWICGFGSKNLFPIFRLYHDLSLVKEYKDHVSKLFPQQEQKQDKPLPSLPVEYRNILTDACNEYNSIALRNAISYIETRGFDETDLAYMKVGYCEDGEMANNLVFPSFDAYGDINFIVYRSFLPHGTYKNCDSDRDIVFNEYMINWDSTIYLVEGPFDAMRGKDNCIPLLGSLLSSESVLFSKLVLLSNEVVVCLDKDARHKALDICTRLAEYGVNAYFCDVSPHKDIACMSRQQFDEIKQLDKCVKINSEFDAKYVQSFVLA